MPPIKDHKTLPRGGRSWKLVGHMSVDAISLMSESLIKDIPSFFSFCLHPHPLQSIDFFHHKPCRLYLLLPPSQSVDFFPL
jgi:hypothetical protein